MISESPSDLESSFREQLCALFPRALCCSKPLVRAVVSTECIMSASASVGVGHATAAPAGNWTDDTYRPCAELITFLREVDGGKKGDDFYLRVVSCLPASVAYLVIRCVTCPGLHPELERAARRV